jgi:hypothetical protein
MRLTQIVEALLFASDAPLSAGDIARVDERLDEDTVEAIVQQLREEYEMQERSFQIYQIAGGYQMLTRPDFAPYLERYDTVPQQTRLSNPALEVLAVIAYRQPIGRSEVEAGLLMTTGGAERDTDRLARRVAIMIQRIAQGEDPANFDVGFPTSQRLVVNMQTAREIGFSPRWQFLADAEQLHAEPDGAQPLTLLGAMRAALDANPALAASRERLGSALDDVRIARSELLPALSASGVRTRIDEDRASPLTQAEDATSVGLGFSQLIYSERAWAGYSIARSLGAAQEHGLPLLVLLFNNAGYRSQKGDVSSYYPQGEAARQGKVIGTQITPAPDYRKLAEAYGGYGERVENPAEVRAAIQRGLQAVASGKLALLDIVLQPI